MLPATDAFPDSTPADQRHTQTVVGGHFSDIDEDEQEEDEATSRSLDVGADDEAPPRIDDVLVAHGICGDTDACMTADVAAPIIDADDEFSAIDPPRGAQAGRYSAPRLSMATPPMAGQSTQIATLTATHMAASSSLDMTRDTAEGLRSTKGCATPSHRAGYPDH